jgi:hypothetical protein
VGSNIKGAALFELFRWQQNALSPAQAATLLERLPRSTREFFDTRRQGFGLLASRWYPSEVIHPLLDAMVVTLDDQGYTRFIEDGAKQVMDGTMRGVFKAIFTMVATPERYARYAQQAWNAYHDTGFSKVTLEGSTAWRATLRDWPGHHRVICDINTVAARLILQSMGKRAVEVKQECCVAKGAPHCVSLSSWQ